MARIIVCDSMAHGAYERPFDISTMESAIAVRVTRRTVIIQPISMTQNGDKTFCCFNHAENYIRECIAVPENEQENSNGRQD